MSRHVLFGTVWTAEYSTYYPCVIEFELDGVGKYWSFELMVAVLTWEIQCVGSPEVAGDVVEFGFVDKCVFHRIIEIFFASWLPFGWGNIT